MLRTFRVLKAFALALIGPTLLPAAAFAEGVLVCGNRPGDGAEVCALNVDYPTTADARNAGLAHCTASGLFNCRIPATFRNTCYAYAFSHWGGWGADGGRDVASAQRAAIALCQRHSRGVPCVVHTTVCDTVDEQALRLAEEQRRTEEQRHAEEQKRAQEEAKARALQEEEAARKRAEKERAEKEAQDQSPLYRRERAFKADMEVCFQGDWTACNWLLGNPALSSEDRLRVRQKHQELLGEKTPPVPKKADAQPAPTSLAAAQLQYLQACERYDLAACHRISKTPLVDFGPGITPEHDERHKRNTRFNIALQNAQTFAGYLKDCASKKRMACEAALAMPNITPEHRVSIATMQAALPFYSLDDPKHFMWTLIALPIFGFLAFFVLARRSPANMRSYSSDVRPLDRLFFLARQRIARIPLPSLGHIRAALASLIQPSPKSEAGPSAAPSTPSSQPGPPRDPETAHAALQLAHSYLSELPEQLAVEIIDNPESAGTHRSTLALAAKQLDIAQRADPTATLTIGHDDPPPAVLTQQWLRARMIQLEALTWSATHPRREIQLLTQATEIDPTFASAFSSLGIAHFLSRNRKGAIDALERAVALDPSSIETRKALDRARHMTDAEIATFKLSNAAAKTTAAGIKTWNVLKLIWIFGLPLAIVLIVAQFTGSMATSLQYIVGIFLASAVFVGLSRLWNWFNNS